MPAYMRDVLSGQCNGYYAAWGDCRPIKSKTSFATISGHGDRCSGTELVNIVLVLNSALQSSQRIGWIQLLTTGTSY